MRNVGRKWIVATLTSVVAIVVVAVAMLWLSGTFRKGVIDPAKLAPQQQAYTGKTTKVDAIARPVEVSVVGSVQSEMRTTLSSRLTANIVSMSVQAGDHVKKGQLLVQLDDRNVKSRVAQAQQALHALEAVRDLAKLETDRLQWMVDQQVASRYELDQWKSRYVAAAAEVIRAQQAVHEAEISVSDTAISSPSDAVVVDRLAEPGDMASPGKALLTIYDPTRLRLEASVREAYIARLDALRKDGRPINVLIEAVGRQVKGVIEQIVPTADPLSRSFIVKVHLDDPSDLYPGMFGRLEVPLEEVKAVEVPRGAVREVGQLSLVRVVEQGATVNRAVRLGRSRGDRVEVLAGLRAGEVIAED